MSITYRFERERGSEVTIFVIDEVEARAGAKATRYFKKRREVSEEDALTLAAEALRCLPQARIRWPEWPRPTGLEEHEHELILPAFLLADGKSEEYIDDVVRRKGQGF